MYAAKKKLNNLVKDSNFNITQSNGQRIYGLRFNGEEPEPPRGTELFIGKLPRDMFEDELVPLFTQIAPIYELRLMMNFMGNNRGYCFVRYFTREAAELAVRTLNHHQVRPDCRLGVYWSLDNTRLFIGGLPKDKNKSEIMDVLTYYMDDIKDIIMYPSHDNYTQNRGYAFLEFENHRAAAIARRRIVPGSIIWDTPIKVDWADPLPEPDTEIMSKVATLYIRNIPIFLTNEEFGKKLHLVVRQNTIAKVHKTLDYAFVHFTSRKAAENAMRTLENIQICRQDIEVTWARPQTFSRQYTKNTTPDHYCMSLPARSRWLIKKKSLKREPSSWKSSDCDDYTPESSRNNTPLFILPRDNHSLEEWGKHLDGPSSSSSDNNEFT